MKSSILLVMAEFCQVVKCADAEKISLHEQFMGLWLITDSVNL